MQAIQLVFLVILGILETSVIASHKNLNKSSAKFIIIGLLTVLLTYSINLLNIISVLKIGAIGIIVQLFRIISAVTTLY